MGLGSVQAVSKVLNATGAGIGDIDLIELNEALPPKRILHAGA